MPAKKKTGRSSITTQEKANTEEKSHLYVNDPSSKEAIVVGHNMPANFNSLQPMKDNSEPRNSGTRRSVRLQNSTPPVGVQVVKPVMEQVNVVEKVKEVAPHYRQVSALPALADQNLEGGSQVEHDDATPSEKDMNLEDKIDYLVQSVDEFKAQGFGQAPERSNEDHSSDFSYKTLYLDSQKKIEALVEENYELVKKLEFARGKIAAYEKMKDAGNGTKEVVFVRATEAATAVAVDPKEKGSAKKRKA